jgi:glycosyltransferase involved in cell wall biosynthesis
VARLPNRAILMETTASQTTPTTALAGKPVALSAFILTRNEERNLEDCLKTLAGWCTDIHLVDSYSTDRTLDIARQYGAHIHQHAFEGHTKQRTWALRNLPFQNEWALALDADHRVTPELQDELRRLFANPPNDIDGFYVKRRQIFRGRWIRHGGFYKYQLKIFKHAKAFLDDNEFDYRFYVQGPTGKLRHDILESNQNEWQISFFIEKHNKFAGELAEEETRRARGELGYLTKLTPFGNPDQRTLWLKERWNAMPLYFRPFALFFIRYFLRLGFLDGKEGFIFHFMQGLWCRLLIDIRREELQAVQAKRGARA